MKCFLVQISHRKNEEPGVLGPFLSREGALKALRERVEYSYRPEAIQYCIDEFGSDFDKGVFYSEEDTFEVIESEIQS